MKLPGRKCLASTLCLDPSSLDTSTGLRENKELFRKKKSLTCHFSFHVWIGEPGVEPLLPECQLAAVSGNDDDEDDVGNGDHDGDGDDVQCHMVTVSGYN